MLRRDAEVVHSATIDGYIFAVEGEVGLVDGKPGGDSITGVVLVQSG